MSKSKATLATFPRGRLLSTLSRTPEQKPTRPKRVLWLLVMGVLSTIVTACGGAVSGDELTEVPSPTASPTVTVTVTPSPTATVTVSPTAMAQSPSPQPSVTATADPGDKPKTLQRRLCRTVSSDLPALTPGDSGAGVSLLQWSLQTVGYYSGAINGYFDEQTRSSASLFQLDSDLGGTGNVASNTWMALQVAVCLAGPETPNPETTDCSGYDLVELQNGEISGALGQYGIWTNDPNTGEFLGLGGVIDQMWAMWFGSPTKRITRSELDRDLAGGFLGADVRRLFGEWPEIYERVVNGLYAKVDQGSQRCT